MAKRQRSLSQIREQLYIQQGFDNEYDEAGELIKSSKPSNRNIYTQLVEREISSKRVKTIDFPFTENDDFILKRVFYDYTKDISELIKEIKKIYKIYCKDDLLLYKEFTNINLEDENKDEDEDEDENEYEYEDIDNISIITRKNAAHKANITGYAEKKLKISSDINLKDFLFKDNDGNFYYIYYYDNIKLFELFKKIYNKTLKLELYDGFYISDINEKNNFITNFQQHHSDKYNKPPQGETFRGGKRILKKYN
jgi:hypothetical protein